VKWRKKEKDKGKKWKKRGEDWERERERWKSGTTSLERDWRRREVVALAVQRARGETVPFGVGLVEKWGSV